MKFTVIEDKLRDPAVPFPLEAGNTHDSDVLNIPVERVRALHEAGFISLEGEEDRPRMDPDKPIRVQPQNVEHKSRKA